ncbi:MAG: hypothetical protein ACI857_003072 [Arenicella sp.]|jgi:hypothetical protein
MVQTELWNRIKDFDLDVVGSQFTFTDRLSRENGWTLDYSVRVIDEYKRFMFLLCCTNGPLTPSDQVDQAWHLHLIYTQSYWRDFCDGVLKREIHHGPTKGGSDEKDKYSDLYQRSKDRYLEEFETDPPEDIWPPHAIRFGQLQFTRVNRHKYWVFPKLKLKLWRN